MMTICYSVMETEIKKKLWRPFSYVFIDEEMPLRVLFEVAADDENAALSTLEAVTNLASGKIMLKMFQKLIIAFSDLRIPLNLFKKRCFFNLWITFYYSKDEFILIDTMLTSKKVWTCPKNLHPYNFSKTNPLIALITFPSLVTATGFLGGFFLPWMEMTGWGPVYGIIRGKFWRLNLIFRTFHVLPWNH